MKVLAAVVTHNRQDLLSRCIDHLKAQTRKPDHIFVVNNASTDGTVAMLKRRGIAHVTQPNVGSAGGWHRCIQQALNGGFDAIWMMDDDGYPDDAALQALVASMREGVAGASAVVVREEDPTRFVFPFPVLDASGLPLLLRRRRKIDSWEELQAAAPQGEYPFAHFFNGALLSIDAVRKVGNVDPDFFMFGEEVDYFFRLRSAGRVISVLSALHHHPDVSQRPYTPAKVYYYLKNTFVLHSRYFDAVWLRDAGAVAAVLARTARRNGVGAALSLVAGRSAPAFYSALVRGLRGQIGKDFRG